MMGDIDIIDLDATLQDFNGDFSIFDQKSKSPATSQHYSSSTRKNQCDALWNLYKDGTMSDVTFIIGSEQKEFKANKAFLAAHSSVFKAMLFGQMMESQLNSEIEIIDIEPKAFESVLKYCYCNDPELSSNNVVSIKQIADKYQIDGLSKLCDRVFGECLNQNNFCKLLKDSMNFKMDGYIKQCMDSLNQMLGKYAKEFVKTPGFMKLDLNSMKSILQCDNLLIGEEDLFEAVMKWVQHQLDAKRMKRYIFYVCLFLVVKN